MCDWKHELYMAVRDNNFEEFDLILKSADVDLSKVEHWEWNADPVHMAARKGNQEMMIKMLHKGANPNAYKVKNHFLRLKIPILHVPNTLCNLLNFENVIIKIIARNYNTLICFLK